MIRHTNRRHRILDEIIHGTGEGRNTVSDLVKRLHLKPEAVSQVIFYLIKVKVLEGVLTGTFRVTKLGRGRMSIWGAFFDRVQAAKVHAVQEAQNVEYRDEVSKQKQNSKQRKSRKQKHRESLRKMRKAGLFAN